MAPGVAGGGSLATQQLLGSPRLHGPRGLHPRDTLQLGLSVPAGEGVRGSLQGPGAQRVTGSPCPERVPHL